VIVSGDDMADGGGDKDEVLDTEKLTFLSKIREVCTYSWFLEKCENILT